MRRDHTDENARARLRDNDPDQLASVPLPPRVSAVSSTRFLVSHSALSHTTCAHVAFD